jgi:predicted dehydrogenase
MRAYNSLDQLLAKEAHHIDVVIVLTPQELHAEHVIALLDAGCPVICEKALATSVTACDSIRHRLHSTGGFLAVTYNYTGYPMLRELKQMVADGKLGRVQQIHIEMPQEGFAKVDAVGQPIVPQEWRLRDGVVPTLSLDLGVHVDIIARFLTEQKPEAVVGMTSSLGNFREVSDNIGCLVRYSGGMQGIVWYGKTALGYRNGLRVRIFGTNGGAEWVQENPEILSLADKIGNRYIIDRGSPGIQISTDKRYQRFKVGHPAGFLEAFANYYADVADALEEFLATGDSLLRGYVFGADESVEGLRFLEAVARSSENGRWESVV